MHTSVTFTCLLLVLLGAYTSTTNITVNTTEELQSVLNTVSPGDFIILGPVNFTGPFVASKNGTKESPITILPIDHKSKLIGTGENGTTGFIVNGSFWNLKYFPIVNFDVGIILINGTGNVLESLPIQNVSSGILVQSGGNVVNSCTISQAVTVGIRVMDQANNTVLKSNAVQDADPSIVLEEGSCCGDLKFNTALGGIELKGSNYTFEGNVFKGILNVTGCKNTFAEEVDMTPSFTEHCENLDVGGNIFM